MKMNLTKKSLEFHELITADGQVYLINANTTRFSWGFMGEGLAKSTIRSQRAPFQDGVTPVDYRFEPRMITMTIRINNANQFEYYSIREELINTFRINRNTTANSLEPATLRKKLPNGDIRDILVFIDMGFLFNSVEVDEWNDYGIQEAIRFFAPEPFYFDPTARLNSLLFTAISDLIFPVAGPVSFGGVSAETDSVVYDGNIETFPIIKFVGPVRNPIMQNLITGKIIELNYIIPVGDAITIDVSPTSVTVTDASGVDRRGVLTSDSDPGFSLVPDPLAPLGRNSFACVGAGTGVATEFIITHLIKYQGI